MTPGGWLSCATTGPSCMTWSQTPSSLCAGVAGAGVEGAQQWCHLRALAHACAAARRHVKASGRVALHGCGRGEAVRASTNAGSCGRQIHQLTPASAAQRCATCVRNMAPCAHLGELGAAGGIAGLSAGAGSGCCAGTCGRSRRWDGAGAQVQVQRANAGVTARGSVGAGRGKEFAGKPTWEGQHRCPYPSSTTPSGLPAHLHLYRAL